MDTKGKAVHDAIKKALSIYRLQSMSDDDGEGYALVDLLTPPNNLTIRAGLDEIDLIADSIWYTLQPVLGLPNPTFSATDATQQGS